jgi:potassium uptake Trk family protein
MGLHPKLNREITFADEVPRNLETVPSNLDLNRIPEDSDIARHVEILERQQNNAKKGGAYYIPGPRDFDRGEVPEQLDQDDSIERLQTRSSFNAAGSDRSASPEPKGLTFADEEHPKRNITIDVPDHPAHRDRRSTEEPNASGTEKDKSSFMRKRSNSNRLGRSRSLAQTWTNITSTLTQGREVEPMPYFAWSATTGRNSAFLGLTAEQREELGGIEYRSLKTLVKILLCYFVGFHTLGMVVLLPWIMKTQPWKNIVQQDGINPGWWGVFTPASMFNDLGFTLTPDSMISFQDSVLALLFGSFLIIIGNTGFPCMLRFIIWTLSKIVPRDGGLWEELRFLLDHPRRCFTLLFPSKATWWLFWVLVLLNGIDLLFFIILDLNEAVVTSLHPGLQVLNGWFQACSTRTAGFASVNLAELHAAIQVSYLIMMYISIFPIAISVRRTNVYEEQSLGLFGGEETADENGEPSYVSQHLRRQLSFDLWYIFLGLFIISIVEGDRIANKDQDAFSTFSVLFEIVSAYGTVGLSLGYPGINASFSAEFRPLSKLIIIAMMIRGRHRGLPYALDRAILLPSEKLQKQEAEASARRTTLPRRGSVFAEENQSFNRNTTWEDSELDRYGLPRQHTIDDAVSGEHEHEHMRRLNTRRSTAMSTNSANGGKHHKRARSLSRVIAAGLSAGPTFPKRD